MAVVGAVGSAAFVHSTDLLVVMALMTAVMQGLDAIVGLGTKDRTKVFGPAGVAVATLVLTALLVAQG